MKKVNIVLPAYNGEKYIGAQIESILNQTYDNIDLYIRDDKSKDKTVEIIKSYIGKEPVGKKIILVDNEQTNWGYVKNVFKTLELTGEADYYAFCDQDDVWLPDKIEKQVALLESKGCDKPALCFTGYNFCDSELNYVRPSTYIDGNLTLQNVVYDFIVLNFNILINKALRDVLFQNFPNNEYPEYPDFWMSQVAAGFHGLYYLPDKLVNYRRNENASSSFNQNRISFLLWRVKNVLFGNETKRIRKSHCDYYACYKKYLSDEDKKLMEMITIPSLLHYFQKIFYPKRFRIMKNDELGLRVFFALGKL